MSRRDMMIGVGAVTQLGLAQSAFAAVPIPKASDGAAYRENIEKAKEFKYAARPGMLAR